MTYLIYGHKSPSNKWYIGRTSMKLERRWRRDGKGYQSCPKFWNAIQKYGWNNFDHIVIAECETEEHSILAETMFKRMYDSIANGYNILIDESINQAKHPEVRKKMSDNHWTKTATDDEQIAIRQKINDGISANLKGKTRPIRSEEWCNKLAIAHTGKKASDETKAKMSESHKGNKSNTGKTIPEETRKKISDSMKKVRAERFWSTTKTGTE